MSVRHETLQIAVWQVASTPGNIAANLSALDTAAEEAKRKGSRLLITPEMYLTGYNIGADLARLAEIQPMEQVREIARRHELAIVIGGPEQLSCGRVANAAWLIDDGGEVLARHHKIQLFGDLDRAHFVAGAAPFTVTRYRGFRIAILICYDVEYPEAVRAASLAGADLVAVPTAQMAPYEFVNEHMIRVRAYENTVYVAYANQYGPDGEYEYVGRSVIADPRGEYLAQASPYGEQLITATVDSQLLSEARIRSGYLRELRRELFAAGEGGNTHIV